MSGNIISVNPVSILITAGNVLILYLILRHFLFKPVHRILDARAKELSDIDAKAKAEEAAAEQKKQQYEEKLSKAESECKELLLSSSEKAGKEADRILSDARKQAANIISDARQKAEIDEKRREDESNRRIAEIVAEAVQKIAASENTDELNMDLYDNFLSTSKDGKDASPKEADAAPAGKDTGSAAMSPDSTSAVTEKGTAESGENGNK